MKAAGYNVVYKGKWHCSKPADEELGTQPSDLERYGFDRWDPPDAGANQSISEAGGGYTNNDGRIMESKGQAARRPRARCSTSTRWRADRSRSSSSSHWSTRTTSSSTRARPSTNRATTTRGWRVTSKCRRPTKKTSRPSRRCRKNSCKIFNLTGKPESEAEKRAYLNFYGNLMRSSDNYLVEVLEQAGIERADRRHADHPHLRPRRDGPLPRRPAAEELQLLRGVAESPAGLLEPEDVPAPGHLRRARLPRRPRSPPWPASPGRRSRRRRNWQGVDYSDIVLNPGAARSPRTTSPSPTTTSSPARPTAPTPNSRTT